MSDLNISHDMHIVTLPHEDSTFAYFFAVDETEGIIAIAKANPWSDTASTIKPFISSVHVDKRFRRQGVARGLMTYIERVCILQNISSIAMYVHEENEDAGDLYLSLGYRPCLHDDDKVMLVKFLESERSVLRPLEDAIVAFCNKVDERAQKLMLADGQVSGKHYAAMRLILKEQYGQDWGR